MSADIDKRNLYRSRCEISEIPHAGFPKESIPELPTFTGTTQTIRSAMKGLKEPLDLFRVG